MNLAKLAVALGLHKDSTQEIVFEALAKREGERTTALESLKTMTDELAVHGLKLDGGKLVKSAVLEAEGLDLAAAESDDEKTKKLKATLSAKLATDRLSQLKANQTFVEELVKKGQVPPAAAQALSRLMGLREKAEVFALSNDGKEVVSTVENARELLQTFLSALPSLHLNAKGLTRVQGGEDIASADAQTEAQALSAKGAAIAQRIRGLKPEKKDKERKAASA